MRIKKETKIIGRTTFVLLQLLKKKIMSNRKYYRKNDEGFVIWYLWWEKVDFGRWMEVVCDDWLLDISKIFSSFMFLIDFWQKLNFEEMAEVLVEKWCFRIRDWLEERIIQRDKWKLAMLLYFQIKRRMENKHDCDLIRMLHF